MNQADQANPAVQACPADRVNPADPANQGVLRKRADPANQADPQKRAALATDLKLADVAEISQFRHPCRCRRSHQRSEIAIDVNLDLRKIANSAR